MERFVLRKKRSIFSLKRFVSCKQKYAGNRCAGGTNSTYTEHSVKLTADMKKTGLMFREITALNQGQGAIPSSATLAVKCLFLRGGRSKILTTIG